MPKRDYTSAPVAQELGLASIIDGLSSDLKELRNGTITPQDALARAAIAKQIFNGVRLFLIGSKHFAEKRSLEDGRGKR